MHEYGHSIDSRSYGPAYLFVIGFPSLISALFSQDISNEPRGVTTHSFFYTERWANQRARDYFGHYNDVDWNSLYELFPKDSNQKGHKIETFFPTRLR